MVTSILSFVWFCLILFPIILSDRWEEEKTKIMLWFGWVFLSLLWIVPIFTGVPLKNTEGQYKGYVTAIEQNGTFFKGWNVYLKTELESSDTDKACINRDDKVLIEQLKRVSESKENVLLEYEGVWQYKIGECPGKDWKIIRIIK